MFGLFYYDWTILIVLPAMFFALWAQMKVTSTFNKYSSVRSMAGLTGAEAARRMLNANGLYNVQIMQLQSGRQLGDHYDPRKKTLFLSNEVYGSTSVAALGVACHEAGHAVQDANAYAPLKIRMAIVPVCNIGSGLAIPLFFVGMLFAGDFGYLFMLAGIACFSLATLFQLITLPVEFNASARALAGMRENGILRGEESTGARKVLSAAAMTYVAALASSLLSLLRLIVIANGRRRD